jgi:putative membrane protein
MYSRRMLGGWLRRPRNPRPGDADLELAPPADRGQTRHMQFLIHWLVTAVALAIGMHVVPGIQITSGGTLIVAALVLGLVNAVVRPVLLILTLPITVLTLGLFYLVVNGLAFALAAWLVPGFTVASLGSAIGGALVVSLLSTIMNWILTPRTAA